MKPTHKITTTLTTLLLTTLLLTILPATTTGAAQHTNTTMLATKTCNISEGTHTNFQTPTGPRIFIIHTPPNPEPNTPMIISLHGATGSSEVQQHTTRFDTITQNTITIYPQSQGTPPETIWLANPNSTDIQYITQLTRWLHKNGCSNPQNTHINGFSMGAMVASRTICQHPNLYQSAAMIAGALPPTTGCKLNKNQQILIIHSKNDPLIKYDGTIPETLKPFTGPVDKINKKQLASQWAKTKNCKNPDIKTHNQTNYQKTTLTCPNTATTKLLTLEAGHAWDNPNKTHTSTFIYRNIKKQL